MDDSLQFIIESPQNTQSHKKRPRLVTSCDNCRLKKIKCLQPSPEARCEACKAAKIQCRFRDRERYFAERSRAITNPGGSTGYGDDARSSTSTVSSPSPAGAVIPDAEYATRYSYSAADTRSRPTSMASPYQAPAYTAVPASDPYTRGSAPPRQVALFDPDQPQRPAHSLMQHFIQLFFEHMGREFAFITYDEIARTYWEGRLPDYLANCIAGMASRYSSLPDLVARGLHDVAEAYTDNAKSIITQVAHNPSIDILHTLMLLSWSEYKNNRMTGFRQYCQMAMNMAMELGLSDQHPPPVQIGNQEQARRRATWQGIVQLHVTNSNLR